MKSPDFLRLTGWVVYATFREALASRLFAGTALATTICIVFCLSLRVEGQAPLPVNAGEERMRLPLEEAKRLGAGPKEGVDIASSEVHFLFGAIRVHYRHYTEDAVRFIQLLLAGFLVDTAGVLLALICTAGFLPGLLEPGRALLLLAKPVPRWALLSGHYLGMLIFVAAQTTAFVVGTWLALGVASREWGVEYLLCIPIVVLHYGLFSAVAVWLAVHTRSTTICLVGSLAFWVLCWNINHYWQADQAGSCGSGAWWLGASYWLLPKPADLSWLVFELLQAGRFLGRLFHYNSLGADGGLRLAGSVATSLLFTALVLALSARRLARADY